MKTFLDDLRSALKAKKINPIEIEDIVTDHRDMIESAMAEGLSEEDIIAKFGDPKRIAEALADDENGESSTKNEQTNAPIKEFLLDEAALSIETDLANETMSYRRVEGEKIRVLSVGDKDVSQYDIQMKHQKLTIKAPKLKQMLSFIQKHQKIEFIVEIPKEMKISTLKHSTLSGHTHFRDLSGSQVELSTVSGDVTMKNLEFETLRWYTVSGDIDGLALICDTVKSSQVSGDVRIENARIDKTIDFDTVSGDIEINDATADMCKLNSVSGDLIGKEFYPNKIALSSVSGDVKLYHKEKRHVEIVSKSSLSGKIKIHAN